MKTISFSAVEILPSLLDKTSQDMFNWFDKHYDLSIPKKFCVYRWRWLK